MRKFIVSLTTVASLSLAAIPVLGLTQAANAAERADQAEAVVGIGLAGGPFAEGADDLGVVLHLEDLERAAHLDPRDPRLLLDAGHASAELGDWGRAEGHWRRALLLEPQDEEALIHLAEARRELEDLEGAVEVETSDGTAGDPQKGRQAVVSRTLGNCIACHEVTALKNEPYHGNTAPSLDGVASRMSEGELRLRVVDGTKVNPDTMMPPFYRVDGLNKVMGRFKDTTILSAEQVEDVVAYLKTLR